MNETLASYARRAVPRYTSYPTAPHFREDFAPATYADWLRRADPARPVSLYLHVPFCRQVCSYCGCNMKLAASYAPVAAYAEALHAEIELVAGLLPRGMKVIHLAWGGGTPTALAPDDLAALMDRLRRHFTFLPEAELSIESDPRTLTPDMAARIGALGFTRASFGVQEFDPKVQQAINRIQPPDMVARAVDGLRGAGVARINFDLIYGLPHQTEETLLTTIGTAAAMRPDRVALFGYAHVPWMAKRQVMIPADALPGPEDRLQLFETARRLFVWDGYAEIGIDHFAREGDSMAAAARAGRLRRNFQGYTDDTADTLIGIGASAISRFPQGYAQNLSTSSRYAAAIEEGRLATERGHAMTAEDRLRADMIEDLMCRFALDLPALSARHAVPLAALRDMTAGLRDRFAAHLSDNGDTIRLTDSSRLIARLAAHSLDARALPEGRHSRAL